MKALVTVEVIEQRIYLIRGQKVMIDRDLVELYGVETKYLNRQVKRNILHFPPEFMFQLNENEKNELVTICHLLLSTDNGFIGVEIKGRRMIVPSDIRPM